jgi:hypothetical protein
MVKTRAQELTLLTASHERNAMPAISRPGFMLTTVAPTVIR